MEESLSRRERQIMDIIYKIGPSTVSDVMDQMQDPPGYNSIRVTLGILEKKGKLKHKKEGQKFVYRPTICREEAKLTALDRVLNIFFEGSAPLAVSTLLQECGDKISHSDLEEISQMITMAKQGKQA